MNKVLANEPVSAAFEALKSVPGIAALAVDDTLHIRDVTRDGCDLLGDGPAELIGRPVTAILAEDGRHGAERLKSALAAAKSSQRSELKLTVLGRDGTTRLLDVTVGTAEDGGSGHAVLVLRDATDYQHSIAQLKQVVEGSIQGIIVHSGGPPLFANDALIQMVGIASREELFARPSVASFIHPDDRERVAGNIAARLRGRNAPLAYDFRLLSDDGRTVWVECRATVVTWDGEPAVLASLYDITDRKVAEDARQKSEALFTKVFQASPEIITITRRRDGRYIDINGGFTQTLGYERSEVLGRTAADLDVWVEPGFRDEMVEELAAKGSFRGRETCIRRKDGGIIDVQFSADTFRYGDEDVLLIVGHDTTARKRSEKELRDSKTAAEMANRAKGEFLANMSHELRTPLNAIIGFAEVLQQEMFGPLGSDKYAEYAADIHSSGEHLLDIINDILDLSKLESGRYELHETEFTVDDLAKTCVRFIRERAREAGLAVRMELPDSILCMSADRRLMKQILLNLLSNAVKFTPNGGTITVGARLNDDGECELFVTDTGVGMNEEGIETALTPFGQVASALSRDHQGTGLGIPLARSLVERHGGSFDIASTPGDGTTVTVTVPADRVVIDRNLFSGNHESDAAD